MRRDTFLGVSSAGVSSAFVAATKSLSAQTLPKLRIGGSVVSDIVGALYATQSGIFRTYGLDVDVQRMNSSAAIVSAVIGGSLDIGKATIFALVLARSKGMPIVLEAPAAVYSSNAPTSGLVVAKNSTIQNARDLNGKVLAAASLGDIDSILNAAWIDQNGGDSRTIKHLELPISATAEAIVSGRVDAGMLNDPTLTEAVKSGKCRIIGRPGDVIGSLYVATAYFCTADFASQNAAVLTSFRKALDEATAYATAHPSEMIPLVAKFSGVDPRLVKLLVLAKSTALLDTHMTQPSVSIAAKYKAIDKPFSVKEMIDPAIFISSH
jgi:NitT/TauT family transport system substrate-binding protein